MIGWHVLDEDAAVPVVGPEPPAHALEHAVQTERACAVIDMLRHVVLRSDKTAHPVQHWETILPYVSWGA